MDFLAADAEILEGNWRKAKGRKPICSWAGADRPLITNPAEARRAIYLPAYATQLAAAEQHPEVTAILAHAETFEQVYLRDHNTGSIEGDKPMGHAHLPAEWLTSQMFPTR